MTERDYQKNRERYSKYRDLKNRIELIQVELKCIETEELDYLCLESIRVLLHRYSDEVKSRIKECLKIALLVELERTKNELYKI